MATLRNALADSSASYKCGNPSCYKLWDPAIELAEDLDSLSEGYWLMLVVQMIGLCSCVAWIHVIWNWCVKNGDVGDKKGAAGKLQRLRETTKRSQRQFTRAATFSRRRASDDQVVQGTVVKADSAGPDRCPSRAGDGLDGRLGTGLGDVQVSVPPRRVHS